MTPGRPSRAPAGPSPVHRWAGLRLGWGLPPSLGLAAAVWAAIVAVPWRGPATGP